MTGIRRPDARTLISTVLDEASWRSWDEPPVDPAPPGSPYADELAAARERTGYDEAVVTGEGLLGGHRVAVIACEFSFLAGTIGVAAADRLVRAIERATRERLPLLAATASGGTRMQEGTLAFVQMVKISDAVMAHRAAGLPYLVYLRHPTTGGVFASWGSLGHLTAAEPGALVGFLGPRVYESLRGHPFPEGVQVAENLHAHSLVDAVLEPRELREAAVRALNVLRAPVRGLDPGPAPQERAAEVEGGGAIPRSRRDARRGVRGLLEHAAADVTVLNGPGAGEGDPGLILALARFGTAPAVVLGQDRGRGGRAVPPLGPAGLRAARRGMRLAAELGLPLVSLIDTAGADLSREAEEGGLAGEIARCIADLLNLPVPTVSVLLGEGAGGAALALLPADRVLCAQHGWLAPLPPEGASAIRYRTVDRAAEISRAQGVRSIDLRRSGVVDRVIPELPDAAAEPREFCARVARSLEYEIAVLTGRDPAERLAARHARYRTLGARPC
nr:MAG: acetyl-CoA carboxyl transferase [Actinomycetota bacterium]